jgi:hypothetical protein
MLTESQCNANQKYFENLIKITKAWAHLDTHITYEIVDDKFVLDTKQKLSHFCNMCSLDWILRNTNVSSISNKDQHVILKKFYNQRGF